MNDTAVPLKKRNSQVNSKFCVILLDIWILDLDIFGGVHWPIFRAGAPTQEHRSREMKQLSYLKNTDPDSTEPKQREAGLPSEPPGTPRISVIPHPRLLKAVPPSPLEMLIPSVELD